MPSDHDDALADAHEAAADLLRLYEALGVPALILTMADGAITVRCQDAADVEPMCRRVLEGTRNSGRPDVELSEALASTGVGA